MEESSIEICGTKENSYVWCGSSDNTGLILVAIVWIMFLFTLYVVIELLINSNLGNVNGTVILTLILFALWSHLKTMLTDPGAIPSNAHPVAADKSTAIAMCGRCDGYKADKSHHDRVSNRCISRMDHFCPWTNNSIGAKNQKHFFLFLMYTDLAAVYLYVILSLHLVFCSSISCVEIVGLDLILVRVEIFVLLFTILFTSSMIVNQIYGLVTGVGTIDRMKLKSEYLPDEEPIPFNHVFGDQWYTHLIPTDPVWENPEAVLHYRICQESYSSLV